MKRLVRTRKDRILSGVCGGFAEFFGVNPAFIRLIWIFFTLFGGSGILAYIAAVVIIPDELENEKKENKTFSLLNNDRTILWGALLVVVGIILFIQYTDLISLIWVRFWGSTINLFFAFALISYGIYLIYTKRRHFADFMNEGAGLPLHLSQKEKKFAGVCSGIAESVRMDSTVIRFLWVYGTFMSGGVGVLLYLILALILPQENFDEIES